MSTAPVPVPVPVVTNGETARAGAKMDVPEDLRGFNLLFFITEAIGLVGVVMMAIWTSFHRGGFAWRSNPGLEFNWHPLLNTIGMIYLFANSILVYRALRTIRKKTLKLIHAAIHFVVLVLVLIAFIAVLDSHNLAVPAIPNFYSLHSWLGIVTVLIYVLQWVFGFAAFLYPGFPQNLRGAIMPIHTFMGLLAFVLAIATAFTGLTEKALFSVKDYSAFSGETYLINFMGLIFILFGGMVVYLATEPKYKRYPRPEDGGLLSGSSE
ncbi:plasma membrane ascorbate-dependent reductase CYBRD1-like isoform X2 [Macrosteles quadrilineatus]|uniref:plasma membrane ascorbate-dependent reductase CYBRD1-like isoform X2 n=1 Tax=Macrosteles quadrilineatus TaxID=74068 RepID=UPI0023E22B98|nr:plasma membrane ascorbate-dependent reductase CYBRD1-like isoform X2 [Macrosteles quadrilineatus]